VYAGHAQQDRADKSDRQNSSWESRVATELVRADWKLSCGIVEGFNNKLKLITRKSYGFRTQEACEIALYQNLGALPEPEFTHGFF